jgi:excisionase family DNA binding protein
MTSHDAASPRNPTFTPEGIAAPAWSPAQALLTVPQVAVLLGMTPKAIYHRAERGQLPGALHVGRSLRFRRSDLLRFISEGRSVAIRVGDETESEPT